MDSKRKVVVICPYGIGNLVMAYPALKALREGFPNVTIDYVSLLPATTSMLSETSRFQGLFDGLHEIRMPVNPGTAIRSIRGVLSLRQKRYDLSILLFPTLSFHYNLLSFLIGARKRLGFRYPDDRISNLAWLNTLLLDVREGIHDVEQNLGIIRLAGIPPLEDSVVSLADGVSGVKRQPVIGFHTGCKRGYEYKQWDNDNFARVIEYLRARAPAFRIRMFFGPDEVVKKEWFKERLGAEGIEYLSGLSLGKTCELISDCPIFVSNDSGLMHLAVFTGCEHVIAVAGPSDERRTGPYHPGARVVAADIPCRPCSHGYLLSTRKLRCREKEPMRCLASVTPEMVIKEIGRAMDEYSSASSLRSIF
ncbi:glycosyltransferase family 9 protein [Patescibacteria group bacterium]|nr:MAG: glycosyltransferase family 9 protein [Patescibacteria group bacterium]